MQGKTVHNPNQNKPTHAKPSLYAYYFYELKEIALKYGYNLVLHGSLNRDLDLIAIPWKIDAKPHPPMIEEFAKYLGGEIMLMNHLGRTFNHLPQGRSSYVINLNRTVDGNFQDQQYYLDISVTPAYATVPDKDWAAQVLFESADLDQPWSLPEVLKKLIEASDILLNEKNYDGHEREEIYHAANRASDIIDRLQNLIRNKLADDQNVNV